MIPARHFRSQAIVSRRWESTPRVLYLSQWGAAEQSQTLADAAAIRELSARGAGRDREIVVVDDLDVPKGFQTVAKLRHDPGVLDKQRARSRAKFRALPCAIPT